MMRNFWILSRDLGQVLSPKGEKVSLFFISSRDRWQRLPDGGVLIAGQVDLPESGEESITLFPPSVGPTAFELERFSDELRVAVMRGVEDEKGQGGDYSTNALDFFHPFVTEGDIYPSPWTQKTYFVYAFREREAAKAAFAAGLRAGDHGWAALRELEKVAA